MATKKEFSLTIYNPQEPPCTRQVPPGSGSSSPCSLLHFEGPLADGAQYSGNPSAAAGHQVREQPSIFQHMSRTGPLLRRLGLLLPGAGRLSTKPVAAATAGGTGQLRGFQRPGLATSTGPGLTPGQNQGGYEGAREGHTSLQASVQGKRLPMKWSQVRG